MTIWVNRSLASIYEKFPFFIVGQIINLPNRSYFTKDLLSNNIKILLILKGLVYLDDLRMIQRGKDRILSDDIWRILDVLLPDSLDCSNRIGIIPHLCLIDYPKRASSDHLHIIKWVHLVSSKNPSDFDH